MCIRDSCKEFQMTSSHSAEKTPPLLSTSDRCAILDKVLAALDTVSYTHLPISARSTQDISSSYAVRAEQRTRFA